MSKTKSKAKPQLEKFKEAAREHGADEDEAAFKRKLAKLGKPKPKKDQPEG